MDPAAINSHLLPTLHLIQQHQTELLNTLLTNSPTGIVVYQALRQEDGTLTDFMIISANPAAIRLSGHSADALFGQTLLTRYPHARTSGLFDRLAEVIHTGNHCTSEEYDPIRKIWFDLSISPFNDGFVINFTNVTERKQNELRQDELVTTLNGVLDGSINSIMSFRAIRNEAGNIEDFEILTANQAAEAYLQLSEQEMVGQRLLALFPENWSMGLFDMYVRTIETGEPQRMQAAYGEGNQKLWLDESATRLSHDSLVVTFMDITESRLALQTVEEQANWLRIMLDGAISGMVSLEAIRNGQEIVDFRFLGVNRAAEKIVNRSEADLINQSLLDMYPGHVEAGLFALYRSCLQQSKPARQEVYINTDGYETWLDVSVSPTGDDRLVVSFANITDARKAQDALIGESVLFKTLSNNVPETGVLVCDHSLRILYANGDLPPAFQVEDQKKLMGKLFPEVVVPAFRQKGITNFNEALAGRTQQMVEQVGDLYYEVFFAPVHNDTGQTVMGMVTFRNITQTRLFQQQLEESVNELKRSNASLEEFAYVASHDLQEPLRKVQAFGDLLADQYAHELSENGADLLRRMQKAARRMSDLIRDLLTYSRLSAQRPPRKPVALNRVLTEVLDDLETAIRDKKALIHVGSLPVVQGDALQLRQLFQNLLSNALKFTRPDVQPAISVTANLHTAPVRNRQLVVEIVVSDNGIGFDPSQAERIFQVFQRLHGRNDYSGTGVGLAIVQKVIQNHGGGIIAEGYPNKGATFKLILPIN